MPRPIYVICAERISEDKTTNLLSFSFVVERVLVTRTPLDAPNDTDKQVAVARNIERSKSKHLEAFSVWMSEEGDDGVAFEHEFVLSLPGFDPIQTGVQPFVFGALSSLSRFSLSWSGLPQPKESCNLEVESRVRREGEEDWKIQSYPIAFWVVEQEKTHETKDDSAVVNRE